MPMNLVVILLKTTPISFLISLYIFLRDAGMDYFYLQKRQDHLLNHLGSMDPVQKLQLLFLDKN